VKYAGSKGKSLSELDLTEYRKFSSLFGKDVYDVTIETSLSVRNIIGGTAPKQVAAALARARKIIVKENEK